MEKIIERGKVVKNGRGKYQIKQNHFSKIDDFWKKVIWQFMVFTKIKLYQCQICIWVSLKKFQLGLTMSLQMEWTMLHMHLIKIRFQYQKKDNWKVIMESQNSLLGGTKDDGTKLFCIRTTVERKARSNTSCWKLCKRCREFTFILQKKRLSETYKGYHDDMNEKLFEDYFKNVLIPTQPKERKVVING